MLWMRLLLLLLTAAKSTVAVVAVVVCGLKGFVKVSGVG